MDKNGSENDENQLENVLTKTILNLEEIDTNLYRYDISIDSLISAKYTHGANIR